MTTHALIVDKRAFYARPLLEWRPGIARYLCAPFFFAASLIYACVAAGIGFFFKCGIAKSRVYQDMRLISVGNISCGGTGKTPLVMKIARHCRARGERVGVLMRGYGKDESAMLQERLRGVPIVRSPDRFAGLRQLSREGIKTVVLDDAFQRRNLARDVDIVLIDARTFSRKDFFLPLGSLREPLRSARRADIIVITKADAQPSAHEAYEKFLARIGTQKDAVFFSSYTATCGRDVVTGEEISLATLRTQRVAGFCGIANPEYFYDTLKNNTAGIDAFYIFPDHYGYRGKDLAPVLNRARAQALGAVVITAKDAAGLRAHIAPEDLRALASSARIVSLEITMDCSDEEKFFQRIDTLSRT